MDQGVPVKSPSFLVPTTPTAQVSLEASKATNEEMKMSEIKTNLPPLASTSTLTPTTLPLDASISITLNTIVDSVVVADAKGQVLCFNKAASQMFGWSADEVVGKQNVSILMPAYYSKEHDRFMSTYADGLRPPRLLGITRTLKGRRKDGSNFPIDISLGEFPKEWIQGQQNLQSNNWDLRAVYVATIRDAGKGVEQGSVGFGQSRYEKEFQEIEFLGKGGFGAVYRAKNVLDGQEYAVKKLRLSCRPEDYLAAMKASPEELEAAADELEGKAGSGTVSPTNSNSQASLDGNAQKLLGLSKDDIRIIREVKTFAKISTHPNIVRYFNSWVEATIDNLPESVSNSPKKNPVKLAPVQTVQATKTVSAEEMRRRREEMVARMGIKVTTPNGHIFESRVHDDSYCSTCDGTGYGDHSYISNGDSFASSCHDPDCSCTSPARPMEMSVSKPPAAPIPGAPRSILKRADVTENSVVEKRRVVMNPQVEVTRMSAPSAETTPETTPDYTPESSVESSQPSPLPRMLPAMPNRPALSTVNALHAPPIQRSLSDQQDDEEDDDVSEQPRLPPNHPPIMSGGVCPMQRDGGAMVRSLVANAQGIIAPPSSIDPQQENVQKRATILFIQMQLCSNTNLHKFLAERNQQPNPVIDRVRNIQIFEQIVRGLMHVHASGFVHRDIKPGNVFLEGNHVFVGDFGLAKDMNKTNTHHGATVDLGKGDAAVEIDTDHQLVHYNVSNQSMPLTLGVGTLLYASPEQLSCHKYDSKTDIYSLGVLFFELFHPLPTPMERVNVLMDLRRGVIPPSFQKRWPKEHDLLQKMIATDPTLRPTAIQILASDVIKGSAPLKSVDLSSTVSRRTGEARSTKTQLQLDKLAGKLTELAKKNQSVASDSDESDSEDVEEECTDCAEKDDLIRALKKYTRKMEKRIEELEKELEKRMKI